MDNRKTIQTALDYIEENLKAEISVSDLSDMTGYSLYHFYRLFQSATGMPVMQYILRRKLLNAIYDISSGLSKTEAALLYGFETYAGFYKAFKREMADTEYLIIIVDIAIVQNDVFAICTDNKSLAFGSKIIKMAVFDKILRRSVCFQYPSVSVCDSFKRFDTDR